MEKMLISILVFVVVDFVAQYFMCNDKNNYGAHIIRAPFTKNKNQVCVCLLSIQFGGENRQLFSLASFSPFWKGVENVSLINISPFSEGNIVGFILDIYLMSKRCKPLGFIKF